ncbi:MAG: PLP-dependent aminotransferase family protein [Clostridia bacterium]
MPLSFRIFKDDDAPLYVQAASAIRGGILDGSLRPGDRLPSVRKLSDELGVNPATVVAAYRILTSEGLLQARHGSGAFVAETALVAPALASSVLAAVPGFLRESAGAGTLVDMAANAPPRDLYPLDQVKRFMVEAIDMDGGQAFDYQQPAGYPPLREALVQSLSFLPVASRPGPNDVHVVSGAQQGLDLAARILLRPGDVAAVESPGYPGARTAFLAAGARVAPLELKPEGLDLSALEKLAASRPLRLVYVNPDFQNPTGRLYTAENRERLASLAARYGFYVIEDDLFSDLAYSGTRTDPVLAYDKAGVVLYVKSFSKILMPGLRIACLVSPAPFRERLEAAKRSVDLSSNGLMQRVLKRFITSGSLDSHLVQARARYRQARDAFASGLSSSGIDEVTGLRWERPEGGINAWLELPESFSGREVTTGCLQRACAVLPEADFLQGGETPVGADRHLRVSFGSPPLEDACKGSRLIVETLSSLSQATGKRL